MHQIHTLNNGLRILMVPVQTFQSVSVGFFVGVGSRYEDETQAGMSHFIEHMLFKGSTKRPSSRIIAEAIEGIGGITNAYTSQDTTVYYAKVAASQVSTAIDVLADMVRNPLFEPHDIKKEQLVIGEEINMVFDMPDSWVGNLSDQLLWPNHPLGQPIAGTHQSLVGINANTLLPYFRNSYHPQNVLVAIGGAFNPEEVLMQINDLLGSWQPGSLPTFADAPPLQTQPASTIEHRPIEQGHLCLAMPALSRRDPDRYALAVLNTILGDGMSSRLFLNIREDKGLAYAVDSGLNFLQDTGSLVIYAGVDPKRAVQALQAILDELDRIRIEPVPAEELYKAKEYLKGRLVLGLEDSYSQTAWIAYQMLFLDTIKSPEDVMAAYDAVTTDDVLNVARRVIIPSTYTLAGVGPFGKGDELANLLK